MDKYVLKGIRASQTKDGIDFQIVLNPVETDPQWTENWKDVLSAIGDIYGAAKCDKLFRERRDGIKGDVRINGSADVAVSLMSDYKAGYLVSPVVFYSKGKAIGRMEERHDEGLYFEVKGVGKAVIEAAFKKRGIKVAWGETGKPVWFWEPVKG